MTAMYCARYLTDIFLCFCCSFFERDVNCVREYFRRRFGYECAGFPVFEDLTRDDDMDIEVACSGFTKQMEHDLLQEYGMESGSDDGEDNDAETDSLSVAVVEQTNENTEYTETELNALRQQFNTEVEFAEERKSKATDKNASIQKYIESLSQHFQNATFDEEVFEDALDDTPLERLVPVAKVEVAVPTKTVESVQPVTLTTENLQESNGAAGATEDNGSVNSNDPQSDDDELGDLDTTSREYRMQMVKKLLDDARSHRSYSTTASTIAPTVIKDRIRKSIDLKKQQDIRKRCVAKGEASAITRKRNENRDTCKEYAGWDF